MRKVDFHRRALRGGIAVACLTLTVAAAQAGPNQLITFDVPGAGTASGQGTYPSSISGASLITGKYVDSSNVSHGFIGTATGTITTFDSPGAGTGAYEGTTPTAINKSGEVAGYYTTTKNHGFVRDSDGTFHFFDISLGTDTTPTAINSRGVVTGSGGGSGGFVRLANGSLIPFSVSGAASTLPQAINTAGTVAGYYFAGDNTRHGFFRARNGAITTFDVPGGFENTNASGINNAGDITGYAVTGGITPAYVGYVRKASDGSFSIFYNIAGCQVNYVFPSAINFDGTVVGTCLDENYIQRGFIRHSDGTVTSFAAPNSASGTNPNAIAANGKTVGFASDVNSVAHGFRLNAGIGR
jgi:hypothetical protein